MKKWLFSLFNKEDGGPNNTPDFTEAGGSRVISGQSFEAEKDPDHLPPTNRWQVFGKSLRKTCGILGSPESAYGLRVALATLSISIIAFLENTQIWYLKQRIVWAVVMISIGMTLSAGDGVFGFLARVGGTGMHFRRASEMILLKCLQS